MEHLDKIYWNLGIKRKIPIGEIQYQVNAKPSVSTSSSIYASSLKVNLVSLILLLDRSLKQPRQPWANTIMIRPKLSLLPSVASMKLSVLSPIFSTGLLKTFASIWSKLSDQAVHDASIVFISVNEWQTINVTLLLKLTETEDQKLLSTSIKQNRMQPLFRIKVVRRKARRIKAKRKMKSSTMNKKYYKHFG